MELSYTQHYSTNREQQQAVAQVEAQAISGSGSSSHAAVDITFTATTSASGSLLIGVAMFILSAAVTKAQHMWQMGKLLISRLYYRIHMRCIFPVTQYEAQSADSGSSTGSSTQLT